MILHRTRRVSPWNRPEFATLIDLWNHASRPGVSSDVNAFDVSSRPELLANLALIELDRRNATKWMATYRYVGMGLRQLLGRDVTGLSIGDAYPPDIADEIMKAIADCAIEAAPVATRREFRIIGIALGYDRLLLPFGRHKDVTLIAASIHPIPAWLRHAAQWQVLVKGHRAEIASSQEQAKVLWASALAANEDSAAPWYV